MNKIIKQQLEKCKIAAIPKFDENTTHLIIPKTSVANNETLVPGKYYQIQIDEKIFNDTTLMSNWNNGLFPPETQLNVCVIQILSQMVKLDCVGEISNKPWMGWLPMNSIKILKELS